jgi:hypothetical protein
MTASQRLTITRLFRIVLPWSQVGQIIRQLEFFEKHHGLKFVVDRMKAYSLELRGQASPQIGKDSHGIWRGPFKPFHLRALRSRKDLRRALNVLRFIHLFKAEKVPGMYRAHKEALLSVPKPSLFYIEEIHSVNNRVGDRPPMIKYSPYLGDFLSFMELKNCARLVYTNFKAFEQLPVLPQNQYAEFFQKHNVVGHCNALVDDGALKVRYVYSPWTALQHAMDPLYWELKRYCDRIPQMFHNNQSLGKERAWELLMDDNAWAVDLKSATDYVPADPQFGLCYKLFPHLTPYIDLAAEISRSHWVCPDGTLVQHVVGQPMGTRFSFLCFSLYIFFCLAERFPKGNFALVGDDLIVPPQGQAYLQDLGFSLSPDKTLSGDFIEFCGTTIDSGGDLRVQRFKNFRDPLSIVDRFGKRSLCFFSRATRKRLKKVIPLPRPIGLGWKPKSIDRLSPIKVAELYFPPDWKEIPPYPITTASYKSDLTQLLAEKEFPPKFTSPRGRWWHEFTRSQYSKLVRKQSVGRVNSILCVIQGLNETFGAANEALLCSIYGVPSDWRSYHYGVKELNIWSHRQRLLNLHYMENLLMKTTKLLSAPVKLYKDISPGNPRGLVTSTNLSAGSTIYLPDTLTAGYYTGSATLVDGQVKSVDLTPINQALPGWF